MGTIDHYRRLFRYDRWANGEVLGALRLSADPSEPGNDEPRGEAVRQALKRFAHILGAEWLWLARLNLPAEAMAVWPELTLDQCVRQIGTLGDAWDGYLAGLDAAGLDKTIDYTNSKGQPWRSRVEDVLMHVVMHSAYHRGQIAVEMRAAGLIPAYTDFIQAVRAGKLGD
ncbi:MAG TPA: DinB family protein [Terriglobia bacterium]|nr:DinB family protein [Terriglobia bacterium]